MSNSLNRQSRTAALTIALAVLAAGTLALSACNTTAGAGRDVGNLGNNIENSANRNK
jgi:predicted small secreted protein